MTAHRFITSSIASVGLVLAGTACAGTYYKCVDAKGAVTMQQTPCSGPSTQEERKAWTNSTTGNPQPIESSPYIRQWKALEAQRKREADAVAAQAAAEEQARAETQRKYDLQKCLSARARADIVNNIRVQQATDALKKKDFDRMSSDERQAFVNSYRSIDVDCTSLMK